MPSNEQLTQEEFEYVLLGFDKLEKQKISDARAKIKVLQARRAKLQPVKKRSALTEAGREKLRRVMKQRWRDGKISHRKLQAAKKKKAKATKRRASR